MNIGIVTTWFERGASYVSRQYKQILEKKHKVFIYARGGEEFGKNDSNWENDKITWSPKNSIIYGTYIDLKHFRNWITANKIDIIFFNEQQRLEPVLYANSLGIKTGAYIDYYTEETIPFFGCYDFLICNTKRHYSTFNWHPQVFYIQWGTNIQVFSPKTFDPVDKECITFFHSSGMAPERKGTDILLKVFEKLSDRSKLIIHSQINLEDKYPGLKSVIEKMKKNKTLVIFEKTVTAPGLYHLGDVYVYPSRLDGIGLTMSEALSCGLPLIVSDNPPMNEFISENNGKKVYIKKFYSRADGYYWPLCEVDEDSLYDNMLYYINNFEKISVYKKNARLYAEKYLNWEENSKVLPDIFEGVKLISSDNKNKSSILAKRYEKEKENFQIKLYKKSRIIFYILFFFWKIFKRIL